jgi:phosphoribosylanthranilate isomerase
MMVKICGITTREDALAAAEAGASALGFNFYAKSPRYIAPEAAGEIGALLPGNILRVGVFVNESPAFVAAASAAAGLNVVQLHGGAGGGIRVWRACRVDEAFGADSLDDPSAEAFLLDTPSANLHGGTGRTFDWNIARGTGKRIILAGGLDASNVRLAIETAKPWGVDACSRLESSPGRKDARKVREFVKAALYL